MLSLKGRKDGFRFLFPQTYIVETVSEKYAKILQAQHSFFTKPVDFLNESIKAVQVLGFNEASMEQQQPARGEQFVNLDKDRSAQNRFLHTASPFVYRAEKNPLTLIDKTFNVTFRHTLGFLNYFMLFENFWHIYARDTNSDDYDDMFTIDIIDGQGRAYSRIVLTGVVINGIDMLNLDYSQPIAQSDTFNVIFKYSDIDYQFLEISDD
jgi:hypothetical protein